MPKIIFKTLEHAERFKSRLIGRQSIEKDKFVKSCYYSGVPICPHCLSFDVKVISCIDDIFKYKCECGKEFFKATYLKG